MRYSLLKKARVATISAAVVGFFVLGPLVDFGFAGCMLAAAVWGAAGFWLIEGLIKAALLPPGASRPRGRIAALVCGKAALYAIAVWALLTGRAAPIPTLIGFSLLLVALVVTTLWQRPSLKMSPPEGHGDDEH